VISCNYPLGLPMSPPCEASFKNHAPFLVNPKTIVNLAYCLYSNVRIIRFHLKPPVGRKQKTPLPMFSNRVICSGILATLIMVGCNSRKSTHLIYPFLDVLGRFGGDLDLKAKNLTQWWGLMIPFAIFDLMVPIGAGIGTFWKRLPGSHRARSHRATLHDYLWT